MKPFGALALYAVGVFLGGALLAPWLYWLARAGAGLWPGIADEPFHRFVNRALLGLALIGLWPLLRALGVRSWADLGLVRPAGQWRRLAGGFVLGLFSLALVAALALAAGARRFDATLTFGKLAGKLGGAVLTAVVVATLEEILFRGGIFGGLRRAWDWRGALVVSSGIYALVHFFAPARHGGEVTWLSGLTLLPQMLRGFADLHALVPGFFTLAVAGVLLAWAYQRTGNLFFSIGLHAGWIFWLRSYRVLTDPTPEAGVWFWGSNRLIDGWLALGALALTGLVLTRLTRPQRESST
ncbi:MAG: CPBP family intramembrane metalloprotease [Verrucomicrobiae bacterium]|nr:CPBP family intramembrane metalloprotease [Verrucomicrobiae bacterium]